MKALQNIRVIDLTKMLPGDYATMMLADYGADVIKVELPGKEDPIRFFSPQKEGLSYSHLALNRNKKCITLDFRKDEGKNILLELIKTADVLIESFRPGFMATNGLSYDAVKQVNKKIVYCSLSGFGHGHEDQGKPAHDLNIVGLTGCNSEGEKEPFIGPVQIAGLTGSMQAAFGILAALNARSMTGEGQHVDVAIMRSLLSLLPLDFSNYRGCEEQGTLPYPRRTPNYSTYRTKDGKYFTAGTFETKFWRRLCSLLQIEDKAAELFDETKKEALFETVAHAFAQKTRAEWEEIFKAEDICVTGVYSFNEAAERDCFAENDMLLTLKDEKLGEMQHLAPPVFLSATPAALSSRAAYPGEHNKQIFSELGLSEIELEKLSQKGLI